MTPFHASIPARLPGSAAHSRTAASIRALSPHGCSLPRSRPGNNRPCGGVFRTVVASRALPHGCSVPSFYRTVALLCETVPHGRSARQSTKPTHRAQLFPHGPLLLLTSKSVRPSRWWCPREYADVFPPTVSLHPSAPRRFRQQNSDDACYTVAAGRGAMRGCSVSSKRRVPVLPPTPHRNCGPFRQLKNTLRPLLDRWREGDDARAASMAAPSAPCGRS